MVIFYPLHIQQEKKSEYQVFSLQYLKIFIRSANSSSEPLEGVLHIPLDNLPALGRCSTSFNHFSGRLAVFRQLFACLSYNKRHFDIITVSPFDFIT